MPPAHDLTRRIRRLVRRRRRPVAAGLAAVGVLLLVASLRPAPADLGVGTVTAGGSGGTATRTGESRVPVTLASPAIAATLTEGDVIDLIAVDEADARVIAPRARVVALGAGGSALTSSSPVIVVAVPTADALDLTAATARGPLAVVIHAS